MSSLLRGAVFKLVPEILPSDAAPSSIRSCHPPNSFRPCRSSRLRRFTLPCTFQVCCALKPTMGFATFQALGFVAASYRDLGQLALGSDRVQVQHPLEGALLVGLLCLRAGLRRAAVVLLRCLVARSVSLGHPLWRSTLRSFPLHDSCAASTVSSGRILPTFPHPGTGFGRAFRTLLAVCPGPPRSLPSRRCEPTSFAAPSRPASGAFRPGLPAWLTRPQGLRPP
jgi:hypothetical protein